MADDRPQSVDQFASAETPADHDETNWGEDWESAFQAEDDAFFSEEKEEDFFLEENEPTVTAGVAAQNLDSSLEKTLSGIPDQQVCLRRPPDKSPFRRRVNNRPFSLRQNSRAKTVHPSPVFSPFCTHPPVCPCPFSLSASCSP